MSLKSVLSVTLLLAGLAAFGAAPAKAESGLLAVEIAGALKDKKFPASTVSADPKGAVGQLLLLNGKDVRATVLLGICYKDGFGTPVSLEKAKACFMTAAKMKDPVAQFWAGYFFLKGIAGAADVPKAVDYLESSAVQGISNAMILLSHIYLEGYSNRGGVVIPEDHALAVRYLRRAAAGGSKEAAMLLGDWFLRGGMIANDPVQAREWFVLAGNHPWAKSAIAEVDYENAKDASAKEEARLEIEKLAAAGCPRAQVYAAKLAWAKGDAALAGKLAAEAAKKDYPAAFTLQGLLARSAGQKNWVDLVVKGAEAGDSEALAVAGFELASSRGSAAVKGVSMVERAARRGILNGLVKMGRIYLQGRLVPKDEARAFVNFKKAAEKGSAEGKYFLSLCYRNGIGCRINYNTAAQLAYEAAQLGDSFGQTLYATYLRDGLGVRRDTTAAMEYLQKAVKQGNVHARGLLSDLVSKANDIKKDNIGSGIAMVQQSAVDGDAISAYSLGRMYTQGLKIPRDYAQGRKNFELAVAKKHPDAYAALAEYYINGWGVKRDFKKAQELLTQGMAIKSSSAIYMSGLCKFYGYGVKKDVNAGLRELRQAAAMGNSDADLRLGVLYAKGEGVPVNEKTAYTYYRSSALRGNSAGLVMLALCLRDGVGVQKNVVSSYNYLKNAAALGNGDAMYELGLMYANGIHVKKDIKAAVEQFRAAAAVGNSYGVYELACCYEGGRGVEKDPVKAAALFRISANAGNRYAQYMFGRCYEGGIGVTKDRYEAVKWYKKAAAGGFKFAGKRAAELQKELENISL